jgi:hypothetical protein
MDAVLDLLILQGPLGAFDAIDHHELTERLPGYVLRTRLHWHRRV